MMRYPNRVLFMVVAGWAVFIGALHMGIAAPAKACEGSNIRVQIAQLGDM